MKWLTRETFEVNNTTKLFSGKTWKQLKAESVMCPAVECFAPLKAYIEQLCHESGKCPNGAGKWGN